MNTKIMSEDELVDRFVAYFSRFFNIYRECWDDQRIGRIDLLLEDRITNVILGVECKRPSDKKGTEVGSIVEQCIQYSRLSFEGKRIPIFLYPALSANRFCYAQHRQQQEDGEWIKDRHQQHDMHHTFNSFLAHLNFGEVRRRVGGDDAKYYDFRFNNECIFSTRKRWKSDDIEGLNNENYTRMLRRINTWEEQSRIFRITKLNSQFTGQLK